MKSFLLSACFVFLCAVVSMAIEPGGGPLPGDNCTGTSQPCGGKQCPGSPIEVCTKRGGYCICQ